MPYSGDKLARLPMSTNHMSPCEMYANINSINHYQPTSALCTHKSRKMETLAPEAHLNGAIKHSIKQRRNSIITKSTIPFGPHPVSPAYLERRTSEIWQFLECMRSVEGEAMADLKTEGGGLTRVDSLDSTSSNDWKVRIGMGEGLHADSIIVIHLCSS